EIVKHDAVAARRNRLVGAIAALPRLRLTRRRRKVTDIRRQSHEIQVLAAVERKFDDALGFDDASDGRVFGLQQGGRSFDLNGLGNLGDFEREIETNALLHLDSDVVAGDGFETRMLYFYVVDARWNGSKCI